MLVGAALADTARTRAAPQHTNANKDQAHESITEAAVSNGLCKAVLDASPKQYVFLVFGPGALTWAGN